MTWRRNDKKQDRLKKREGINLQSESILDTSIVLQEQNAPSTSSSAASTISFAKSPSSSSSSSSSSPITSPRTGAAPYRMSAASTSLSGSSIPTRNLLSSSSSSVPSISTSPNSSSSALGSSASEASPRGHSPPGSAGGQKSPRTLPPLPPPRTGMPQRGASADNLYNVVHPAGGSGSGSGSLSPGGHKSGHAGFITIGGGGGSATGARSPSPPLSPHGASVPTSPTAAGSGSGSGSGHGLGSAASSPAAGSGATGASSSGSTSTSTWLPGSDEDSAFQAADERVQELKALLRKLSLACKKYNTEGLRYSKTTITFAEHLDKMSLAEKRSNTDSVYAEALSKFAQIEREISSVQGNFHQSTTDHFLSQIHEFIEKDINQDLRNLKAKYEKARKDYDAAVGKVTALRQKAKLDVMKLFSAEKELKRLKRNYEDALEEAANKIEEIELTKNCNFLEWLIAFYQLQRDVYGEAYAMLHHVDNYLKELVGWCSEWREIFLENTRKRAEQQAKIQQGEKANLCVPLVQVSQQEGAGLPSLNKVTATNYQPFHYFVRTYYDPISQGLLNINQNELLKDLSSALGLLEKAQKGEPDRH